MSPYAIVSKIEDIVGDDNAYCTLHGVAMTDGVVAVVVAVNESQVTAATEALTGEGEKVYKVGRLVARQGEGVVLKNYEHWDR